MRFHVVSTTVYDFQRQYHELVLFHDIEDLTVLEYHQHGCKTPIIHYVGGDWREAHAALDARVEELLVTRPAVAVVAGGQA